MAEKEEKKVEKEKCPPCDCKKGLPLWLGTFGDLMSLLLCFFVLLLSMATFETKKVDAAIGSLEGALGVLEPGRDTSITSPNPIRATPITQNVDTPEAKNMLASVVAEFNELTQNSQGPAVKLEEAEDGFFIRIPDEILFEPGSSEIKSADAILFLQRISITINKLPNDISLRIIGNTDNVPLKNSSAFRDNWELSIARGISVAKELIKNKVNPARLSAGGDGEFNPISTNVTAEGRVLNRRVDLYFYTTKSGLKDQAEAALRGVI